VEVRSKEEILATLDENGQLDGMPFMPEMLRYCGAKLPVYKRAHKTCDYSAPQIRGRRLDATVHLLDARCGGEAHDGCDAGCLLFWKQAWLKPLNDNHLPASEPVAGERGNSAPGGRCTESDLWARTRVADPAGGQPTYVCQATQVPFASSELNWWDLRQYVEDYLSGNVTLSRLVTATIYSAYFNLSQAGIGLGPPLRWLYNKLRWVWRGSLWPRTPGTIPRGNPTPAATLDLQPGEVVRVKSHEEILLTVTTDHRNRGMHWDAELVPYCGGQYRVLKRVTKIIDEKTAKMVKMKTPCVTLDSVTCQSRYSACRMLCPRSTYPYWREIWLERVEGR
jgi:hypothetical protein